MQQRAVQFADTVNGAIAGARNFTALPDSGVQLSSLQQQLRTVAKLISARASLSMSRQIFFVSTGGSAVVSSGSANTALAKRRGEKMTFFTCVISSATTVLRPTSEPVPAVVGIATQ